MKNELHQQLYDSIIDGEGSEAVRLVQVMLDTDEPPLAIIDQVLNPALLEIGERFDAGSIFLPELILASETMEATLEIMKPYLEKRNETIKSAGRVIMATVQGDVHDIGKNIVCALLKANGFTVLDLGRDVQAMTVIQKAEEFKADIIGLSALLTTTLPYCWDTAKFLEERGLSDKYHLFIGGGAATPDYAEKIGAIYGGAHAEAAVRKMLEVMERN